MVPVIPVSVQHAIVQRVPRPFAYVPTQLPRYWRYQAWDSGREAPGLFPRGRGLNIWFTTPHPSGAGFHVYADRSCKRERPMRTFHIRHVIVSWTTNFGDDRVWRCLRTANRTIQMSVSYIGSATSIPAGVRRALPVARMLTSVRWIH